MINNNKDTKILLQLLADINFGRKYYQLYEKTKSKLILDFDPEVIAAGFELAGLTVQYHSKESFFSYREKQEKLQDNLQELGLNIGSRGSYLEFILVLKVNGIHIGEPFAVLAEDVEILTQPDFEYNPAYPQLQFASKKELLDVIESALNLYDTMRDKITNAVW
jgi:hypothetical protein